MLYLVSDILFNSVQTTEAWSYLRHFEQALPLLMLQLNAKLFSYHLYGKMSREKFTSDVKRLYSLWAEKSIFDEKITIGWLATLCKEPDSYLTFNLHQTGEDK